MSCINIIFIDLMSCINIIFIDLKHLDLNQIWVVV